MINKFRLQLYSLFYRQPMRRYSKLRNGTRVLNVLISLPAALQAEALRDVFWCGQYPKTQLHITLIGNESIISQTFGTQTFYQKYAFLTVYPDLSQVNLEEQDYILSDAVFVHREDQFLWNPLSSVEDVETEEELFRLAVNINLSYDLKRNQRENVYLDRLQYFKYLREGILPNGIRNEKKFAYNMDSSLASAVHIPYKLYYCEECVREHLGTNDSNQTTDTKSNLAAQLQSFQTVCEKKEYQENYHQLLSLEHNRWAAYCLANGFQPLPKNQLKEILFERKENDSEEFYRHFDKYNCVKYHACIAECDEKGILLSHSKRIWNSGENEIDALYHSGELSELNWLSLYCYRKANDIVKNNSKAYQALLEFAKVKGETEIAFAIDRMLARKEGAEWLFQNSLNAIQDETLKDFFSKNYYLIILKRSLQKEDFFAYDEQLIRMIPFCLDFGRNKKVVVTIADSPYNDVILPTLLMPDKAIFVIFKGKNEYVETIQNYYASRGFLLSQKTSQERNKVILTCDEEGKELFSVEIYKYSESPKKSFSEFLSEYILSENSNSEILFNVSSTELKYVLQIGEFTSKYPVLYYDKNKKDKFVVLNQGNLLLTKESHYPEKYFSINEFLSLIQEKEREEREIGQHDSISQEKCEKLRDGFFELWKKGIWNKAIAILKDERGNGKNVIVSKENKLFSIQSENGVNLTNHVLFTFLNYLQRCDIIIILESNSSRIRFSVLDDSYFAIVKTEGGLFEWITFYELYNSCLFDDLILNVKTIWNESKEENFSLQTRNPTIKNEFDVIGMKGFTPIYFSCKAKFEPNLQKEMIYELVYWISKYKGKGVLVLAIEEKSEKFQLLYNRGKDCGVKVIGKETLTNPQKLKESFSNFLK